MRTKTRANRRVARLLDTYLEEINRIPLLTAQDERDLSRRARNGDQDARDQMIQANLRLVVRCARNYQNMGLQLLDLIEEGNLGLLKAVERFDPERGYRFSTYACCWIKHALCQALTDQNQIIRIPTYMRKIITRLRQQAARRTLQRGRETDPRDILPDYCFSPKKSEMVEQALETIQSMDRIQSVQVLSAQQDIIEDQRAVEDERRMVQRSEMDRLLELIETLDVRRADILRMRYALDGNSQPMTLQEVGRQVNLTKERVRQIEKETISLLRTLVNGPTRHSKTTMEAPAA